MKDSKRTAARTRKGLLRRPGQGPGLLAMTGEGGGRKRWRLAILLGLVGLWACRGGGGEIRLTDPFRSTPVPAAGPANTPWPLFQHDPKRSGKSPYLGPSATPVLVWKLNISPTTQSRVPSQYRHSAPPVLDNSNNVFIGTHADDDYETKQDNYFYSLGSSSDSNGAVRWRYGINSAPTTPYYVDRSAALADTGAIYVATTRGYLYAFNDDSSVKSGFPFVFCSSSCSYLGKSHLNLDGSGNVVLTYGSHLKAVSPSGTLVYDYTATAGQCTGITQSSAAIGLSGAVYINGDGYVCAFNSAGAYQWRVGIGSAAASISPSVKSDGSVVYTFNQASPGTVYAIGVTAGACSPSAAPCTLWSSALPGGVTPYGAPALDEAAGYLYLGTTSGIFRLALSNGAGGGSVWFSTPLTVNSSPVLDSGGNLYFGTARGNLYSVNSAGAQRWTMNGLDTDNGSMAIGGDNALYFATSDGWAVKVANATSPVSSFHSNTWKIKYVILREARIGSTTYWERIGATQESNIDAKMQQFADRVLNDYSQGILTVQLTKQVLEVVGGGSGFVSQCAGGDGYFYKGTDQDATVIASYNQGDYDNVIYWWGGDPKPGYSAIGACGIWGINWTGRDDGPPAPGLKNADRMSVHYLGNGSGGTGYDHLEVIEHEWEHGIIDLALPNYEGFNDNLVRDTHNGWGLRQMTPQMWSEASVADPVTSPYIAAWLTLGCFDQAPQGGFNKGIFNQYIPETTIQPDTGNTTNGKTWTKQSAATSGSYDGQINLFSIFSPDPNTKDCVGYMHEYVQSPSDQAVRLWITAPGDLRIFFNGRPVKDTNDLRVFAWGSYGNDTNVTLGQHDVYSVELDLKTGWNRVMIKSASRAGYLWRIGARVGDWNGGTVAGLTYCADKPGSASCPL